MNRSSLSLISRLAGGLVVLQAVACAESGQTGSPFESPDFRSPSGYAPEGGEDGGGLDGGASDPGSRPDYRYNDDELGGFVGPYWVMMKGSALSVFEVSDAEPKEVANLTLRGEVRRLVVEGDRAFVALREDLNRVDESSVIKEWGPGHQERLIAVDLSDPLSPKRGGSIDLEGQIWNVEVRDDQVFVLSELFAARENQCNYWDEGGPQTVGMKVEHLELVDQELSRVDTHEAELSSPYAFYSQDTFFFYDEQGGESPGRGLLSAVQFREGQLESLAPVEVEMRIHSLVRLGDSVFVLNQEGVSSFGVGGGEMRSTGAIELQQEASEVIAINDELLGLVGQQGTSLLDVSDPASMVVASTLSAASTDLVMTEHGLLTWGASSSDRLQVSLWDLSDETNPLLLDQFESEHAPAYREQPYYSIFESHQFHSWYFDRQDNLLTLAVDRSQEGVPLLSFRVSDSGFTLENEQPFASCDHRPRVFDERLVCADLSGVEVAEYRAGQRGDDVVSSYLPFSSPTPLSSARVGNFEVALWEEPEYGPYFLEVVSDESVQRVDLAHRVHSLVEYQGHLLAFGLGAFDSECEYFQEGDLESGQENGLCGDHQRPGLSIIDLSEEAEVSATLEIVVRPLGKGNFNSRADWLGYATIPDGRMAFFVNVIERCNSKAECEEMGVPAYRGEGSPGCDGGDDCSTESIVTYSGHKNTFEIYLLDGVRDGEPALTLATQVDGRFDLPGYGELFEQKDALLLSGHDFALSRAEPVYNEEGNSETDGEGHALVRNYLHRFVIAENGELTALTPINTPGRVILWAEESALSVEAVPEAEGDVSSQVHELRLQDDRAFIEDTQEMDYSFAGRKEADGVTYALFGPKTWCSEEGSSLLRPFGFEEGELVQGESLHLPGRFRFATESLPDEDLTLYGGLVEGARLVIDLQDPLEPRVERYTTEP